ncbi:MAG TPA: hypothetical protein VGP79_09690 [Bryobacteraceae bacterium]|jgi:hypothetical protein|nr:hypothetical protein [Bryobacteraceae bacterium]
MHLIPKDDPPPQSQSSAPASGPAPTYVPSQPVVVQMPSSGAKIPILFGAVVVLLAASGYLFYQVSQLRTELATTKDQILDQISKVKETSSVSTQTSRQNVESLKKELEAARRAANQSAGQAKVDALKHADELAADLRKAQEVQAKKVDAVGQEVSQVKDSAAAANTKIEGVSTEVATVKTATAANRADLEKTIADLRSAKGDLNVQSGLIATNGKELSALKALGERNYTEFKLPKTKTPQRVGDIQVLLKSVDPKKNRYTIEVIADDKRVEKKDRTVNEPLQLLLSRATIPYELVVNECKKDMIVGYLSAPKVQVTRGQAAN